MADCTFCGGSIVFGHGIKFVRKDGRILDFCAKKCRLNMLVLKRKSAKFKWTKDGSKKIVVKKKK